MAALEELIKAQENCSREDLNKQMLEMWRDHLEEESNRQKNLLEKRMLEKFKITPEEVEAHMVPLRPEDLIPLVSIEIENPDSDESTSPECKQVLTEQWKCMKAWLHREQEG